SFMLMYTDLQTIVARNIEEHVVAIEMPKMPNPSLMNNRLRAMFVSRLAPKYTISIFCRSMELRKLTPFLMKHKKNTPRSNAWIEAIPRMYFGNKFVTRKGIPVITIPIINGTIKL